MNTVLNKSEIFKGLTQEQHTSLIKMGRVIEFQPKKVLFYQGDPASSCFLVNRGCLKLTKLNEQGKEVILRYINAGEVTAAIAALKNRTYPATAEAVSLTETTSWDKSTLKKMMRRYPDIAINLLSILLERIDDIQDRYLEVCTELVEQRIARCLLRLMRRAGSKTPEGIHIDIPLSRQNIADYSGTTIYTVSRTLSAWEKREWIQSGREKIVVINPHALVQFSETG